MIPDNISREDVLKAIRAIESREAIIPIKRQSTKYSLLFHERNYPPKYLISLANKYANGLELPPSLFNGGKETNTYLSDMGFQVIEKPKLL